MNFTARDASSSTGPAAAATSPSSFSMGRRTLGVGLAATVLAAGAYAYTASNTFEGDAAGLAGDGSAGISGYHVTNVQYTLDANEPTSIDAVTFTLDAPATTVKASIDTGAYVDCGNETGTTNWTCDLDPNPAVLGAGNLNVVATS